MTMLSLEGIGGVFRHLDNQSAPGYEASPLSLFEGEGWGEGEKRHIRSRDDTHIISPHPFRITGRFLFSSISTLLN